MTIEITIKKVKMSVKRSILFTLLIAVMGILTASISGQSLEEYELKAGIIYRICKYTQWPQPSEPGKPFIISILGRTPPGKGIEILEGQSIHKRKIIIRKIKHLEEINGSDVLFIASSEAHRLDAILDYIASKPILTVGDTRGFGQRGVIINFFIQIDRLKFEINYEASKKAKLQMHSQLFTIGRVVKTRKSLKRDGDQ